MNGQGQRILEIAENRIPYWSRFVTTIDLRFDPALPGGLRTQFNAGADIPVFDYRRGNREAQALAGATATSRDTILNQANQTRGGAMYRIYGVSITKDGYPYVAGNSANKIGTEHTIFTPTGVPAANGGAGPIVPSVEDFRGLDSFMLEILQKYFFLQLQIDGTTRIIEFGPSMLYPGVAGPKGVVDTTNGDTFWQNFMYIKEGIDWNPSGATDSAMQILLQAAYDCVTPTFTAPDGLDPNGDPIPDANPTPLGRVWTQAWIMSLHGIEVKPTSQVS